MYVSVFQCLYVCVGVCVCVHLDMCVYWCVYCVYRETVVDILGAGLRNAGVGQVHFIEYEGLQINTKQS